MRGRTRHTTCTLIPSSSPAVFGGACCGDAGTPGLGGPGLPLAAVATAGTSPGDGGAPFPSSMPRPSEAAGAPAAPSGATSAHASWVIKLVSRPSDDGRPESSLRESACGRERSGRGLEAGSRPGRPRRGGPARKRCLSESRPIGDPIGPAHDLSRGGRRGIPGLGTTPGRQALSTESLAARERKAGRSRSSGRVDGRGRYGRETFSDPRGNGDGVPGVFRGVR